MGTVILGRYTRLRSLLAASESIAEIERPDATSVTAAAQFHGAEEVWGLTPDQPFLLTGSGFSSPAGQEQNRIAAFPAQPVVPTLSPCRNTASGWSVSSIREACGRRSATFEMLSGTRFL